MVTDTFDVVIHPGIYFNKNVLNKNNAFAKQIFIAISLTMVRN